MPISPRSRDWRHRRRGPKGRFDARTNYRLRSYGLTPENYQMRLDVQKGLCAICQQKRKLGIDHNHKTGEVRELLCHRCNVLLGLAQENIETLEHAITYLKDWA